MQRPLLNDDVIALRAPEPSDVGQMYEWENDTTLWSVGRATAPYSRAQLEAYVACYDADIFSAGQLRMVIVDLRSGEPAGVVDLYEFDPVNRRAGVGILVDRCFQGRGIASRAISLLGGYCSGRIGMHQLWAVVPADNEPCRQLFVGQGYKIAGRLRSWVRSGRTWTDAYLLQLLFP